MTTQAAADKRTVRIIRLVIGGILAVVATIVIVTMVTDANNAQRARDENRRIHDLIVNGVNPGYSQQQLDAVCAEYPEAC